MRTEFSLGSNIIFQTRFMEVILTSRQKKKNLFKEMQLIQLLKCGQNRADTLTCAVKPLNWNRLSTGGAGLPQEWKLRLIKYCKK